MKKLLSLIMISITIVLNTGCEKYAAGRQEVENLTLTKLVAVDKSNNKIKLISVARSVETGGGQGAPKIESEITTSEGSTIFDAVRLQHTYSDKKPFWGRTEHFVIGEYAAKDGVRSISDFFLRDHESRQNIDVFIVRGSSAEDIIKKTVKEKAFIGDILKTLTESCNGMSMSTRVKLYELSCMLDSKTSSPYLPCLQEIKGVDQTGSEPPHTDLQLIGLAVFKEDRLSYYLDGRETRGFNWIKGDVRTGIIVVKDPEDQEVSLEIITAERKIKTDINNGIPIIDVNIEMSSNIGEQWSAGNIYRENPLDYLESQQEEIIKTEVLNVIRKAQEKNTDIFGFGDTIYHQHPGKWKAIEKNWEEIFPEMEINVSVKSKINRTYEIEEPSQHEKAGEEK